MERSRRPYSLFKRPAIRPRHIYYCRFRGEDGPTLPSCPPDYQTRPTQQIGLMRKSKWGGDVLCCRDVDYYGWTTGW